MKKQNFFKEISLSFPITVRTALLFAASVARTGLSPLARSEVEGKANEAGDNAKDYDTCCIHQNIKLAASAQIHAMTHCSITTMKAHLEPSSRRMEAMAATQGV